jgi:DNA-binding GntR family transcriptional regulator
MVTEGMPGRRHRVDSLAADPSALFRPQAVVSLRDRAYDEIRDAILSGRLDPGARIKERDVAAQMGVSTTPVKEALRRLEQEGLVVSQPRRGAVVSPLVSTPATEILELRADLEGLAARLAALKMTEEEKATLARQCDDGARDAPSSSKASQERAVDTATAFHRTIHIGCRNAFVVKFLETIAPFDRTLRRQAILNVREWPRDQEEHRAILEAIQQGDADTAERVMHEHIVRVSRFAPE